MGSLAGFPVSLVLPTISNGASRVFLWQSFPLKKMNTVNFSSIAQSVVLTIDSTNYVDGTDLIQGSSIRLDFFGTIILDSSKFRKISNV